LRLAFGVKITPRIALSGLTEAPAR
jgi:hypothetical protein